VAVNPYDEAAFLRIVNMPRRGIGDATLHLVHDLCRAKKLTLGQSLAEVLRQGMAPSAAEKGIREFLGLLKHFRQRFRERSTSLKEIAAEMVAAIDYRGEIDRACKTREQAFNRWQNVQSVFNALEDYERQAKVSTLTGFLDASHLNTDQDRAAQDDRRKAAVTLMTIHSAKGLEFPFVFIMGLEEGLLPHERSLNENALDEERRLFYVALTRGKRHVTLFEAISRTRHGRERMTKTSRFLQEIPDQLLRKHVRAVREMVEEHVKPSKPKLKKRRLHNDRQE